MITNWIIDAGELGELEIIVDFFFQEEIPGYNIGHPDKWEPSIPEEFEIYSVTLEGTTVPLEPVILKYLKDKNGPFYAWLTEYQDDEP